MNRPPTHYEQVPVATVKTLTEKIDPEQPQTLNPVDALATPGDWRQLAEQVQLETDSERLLELVRLLIARFDEQTRRPGGPVPSHRQLLSGPRR